MIGRDRLVDRSMGNRVSRSSSVLDISNISAVGISNLVVDSLESAIRKSNRVRSSGGISITVLSSIELGSRVVISNCILITIHSRSIILRLLVGSSMDRGMVGRLSYSMVNNRGSMVGRGVMDNRGSMVSRGMVDNRGMVNDRGMVNNWGSVVDRGMVDRGVIRSRGIARDSSRSMDSSSILLSVVVGIDRLRSSMGLAGN